MILIRGVLGAILAAITAVQASPYDSFDMRSSNLRTRALATHDCVDFGTGAPNGYHSFGQVCIDIDTTNVKVTYPTLPTGDSYTGVHLYLGTSAPTDRAPGNFPYNGYCSWSGTSASCTVPLSAITFGPIGCNEQLFVASQADVSGPIGSGTGWGNVNFGIAFDCANLNSNCAKFWTFYTDCKCPVVTTFESATCTSTITTTTVFTTKPPDVTGSSTTCSDPGTTSTVTVDGGPGTCPTCASPYFCGCSVGG